MDEGIKSVTNTLAELDSAADRIGGRETKSNGLRISYDDLGEGEPALLFMPGWCGSRAAFSALLSRCSAYRRGLTLDWRGHGQSEKPPGDFTAEDLLQDALAVIEASGVRDIVPVTLSHAGWVAIELRRRLGRRIPKLVLVDWITVPAPRPFLDALNGLQSAESWAQVRDQLFSMWLDGVSDPKVIHYVREDMGTYGFPMWQRAAREITAAYARMSSPIEALASLDAVMPTLHMYSRPNDPAFSEMQQSLARKYPWSYERELKTRSHIATIEAPDQIAAAIEGFVARDNGSGMI